MFQCGTGRYQKTSKKDKITIEKIEIEYAYICKNLFILKLPKILKETTIEDLYDSSVTSTILNGKSFTKDNQYDTSLYYGKVELLTNIIKKNKKSINYKNFDIILEAIDRLFLMNLYFNLIHAIK